MNKNNLYKLLQLWYSFEIKTEWDYLYVKTMKWKKEGLFRVANYTEKDLERIFYILMKEN